MPCWSTRRGCSRTSARVDGADGRDRPRVAARIGRARVSTLDQDLDARSSELEAEGRGVIRAGKVSSGVRDGRTERAAALEVPRPGGDLVVTRDGS